MAAGAHIPSGGGQRLCVAGRAQSAAHHLDLPHAALYACPEPRKQGARGRPRTKGVRLPKPSALADSLPAGQWRTVKTCERNTRRERLVCAWAVVWAHVSKKPILLIVSQDPEGKEADDFFFSTDIALPPVVLINEFADRWSVEDTFRSVKQFLCA